MFAVHIFDVNAIENKKAIENIVVSAEIASVLLDLDSTDFPLLSEITFIDHELFGVLETMVWNISYPVY